MINLRNTFNIIITYNALCFDLYFFFILYLCIFIDNLMDISEQVPDTEENFMVIFEELEENSTAPSYNDLPLDKDGELLNNEPNFENLLINFLREWSVDFNIQQTALNKLLR